MISKTITALLIAAPLILHTQGTTQTSSLSDHDRAGALLQAIQLGLKEPATPARDARLEGFLTQLDSLPDVVAFDQKMPAHQRMSIAYRVEDQSAAMARHATWIVTAAKTCTVHQQKQFTSAIVGAYLDLAQSLAAGGQPDQALALLRRAPADLPGIPSVAKSVSSDVDRLALVGTAAAPLSAPRWLNRPAGETPLDMKGQVTLLEFSAHWCIPCKKSYEAINRLREKYGRQGFRVVMATELYGYFERETNLSAAVELDRDRGYFAGHHLDVPVAINDDAAKTENPNATHYKVLGLPQIVIVDRRGVIRYVSVGYTDSDEASIARVAEQLLK